MDCKRCGTCCEKGGPVLHFEDRDFLQKGLVSMDNLQVIREGELAFNPFKELVEPTPVEMIKLAVQGDSWECPFHQKVDGLSACQIHADRPVECRLLKCWNTRDIEAVTFKNCLTRFDLLGQKNAILPEIARHEKECSYRVLWDAVAGVNKEDEESLLVVRDILARDLQIRQQLVADFHLNLQQELFYLGQPMFRVVRNEEFVVSFTGEEIQLQFI